MFVEAFEKKYGYKPEWGAENAYMEFALWAEAVENAGTLLSARRDQVLRDGRKLQSMVGEVYFRKEDHQLRAPGGHREGQGAEGHEEQGGLLGGGRGRARRRPDAEAGRVRLQARRLHLRVCGPWRRGLEHLPAAHVSGDWRATRNALPS